MFLREKSDVTVEQLVDIIVPDATNLQTRVVAADDVEIDLIESRALRVGEDEVPITDHSYQALGKWLDVPYKFLERQDRDFQQVIANHLLNRLGTTSYTIEFHPEVGLRDVRDPGAQVIDPRRFVHIASDVIDPEAMVVEHHCEPEYVQFEVVVPEAFDRGWGGDPSVGDITAGGLRFGQDRKRNLAPWVQPYFYRLACTNGFETHDDRYKVDARGGTIEALLEDLEAKARLAFANVEGEIEAFYRLREEFVEEPTQAVFRMASEASLPDRMVNALVERVPEVIEDPARVSLFDLVNLVTNQANDPSISGRLPIRRSLEQAGGAQVSEHIARCRVCASRLN